MRQIGGKALSVTLLVTAADMILVVGNHIHMLLLLAFILAFALSLDIIFTILWLEQ